MLRDGDRVYYQEWTEDGPQKGDRDDAGTVRREGVWLLVFWDTGDVDIVTPQGMARDWPYRARRFGRLLLPQLYSLGARGG